MAGDIHVQNLPPIVADNKEAVQQLEGDRWDGEEIHGRNGVPMIANKGLPAPGKSWISGSSFDPTGDASLGYNEAQHEQLAVNPRSTPGRIIFHHLEDEIPDFADLVGPQAAPLFGLPRFLAIEIL